MEEDTTTITKKSPSGKSTSTTAKSPSAKTIKGSQHQVLPYTGGDDPTASCTTAASTHIHTQTHATPATTPPGGQLDHTNNNSPRENGTTPTSSPESAGLTNRNSRNSQGVVGANDSVWEQTKALQTMFAATAYSSSTNENRASRNTRISGINIDEQHVEDLHGANHVGEDAEEDGVNAMIQNTNTSAKKLSQHSSSGNDVHSQSRAHSLKETETQKSVSASSKKLLKTQGTFASVASTVSVNNNFGEKPSSGRKSIGSRVVNFLGSPGIVHKERDGAGGAGSII